MQRCWCLFFGLACGFAFEGVPPDDALASLSYGEVEGNLLLDSKEFLGIPFAAKPVRFAPTAPYEGTFPGGRLQARSYSPFCVQTYFTFEVSEDCLYLNVYTPRGSPPRGQKWPVMLWIHGGALITGSANEPQFNASTLAARENVIVVTINYRLNIFGFATTVDEAGVTRTNLGFLDQREAMRWVRRNIGAFGGDQELVTIFGQSAGGLSTITHLASLGSAGLFDRAIAESGDMQCTQTLEEGRNFTDVVAQAAGCSSSADASCLGQVDASRLLDAFSTYASRGTAYGNIAATIDGDIVRGAPADLIRNGTFNRVPVMFGSNSEEMNLWLAGHPPGSADVLRCALGKVYGSPLPAALRDLYAPFDTEGVDNWPRLTELLTDIVFACDHREVGLALARGGNPALAYVFKRSPGKTLLGAVPGAVHGAEIPYVFSTLSIAAPWFINITSTQDVKLAERVGALWAAFARNGRVDGWPSFEAGTEARLKLDAGIPMDALDLETGFRRGQCDALEAAGIRAVHGGMARAMGLIDAMSDCQGRSLPKVLVV